MKLNGKYAFITGAASGIGFALANECAARGMKLIITDIEEQALNRAQEQLGAMGAEVVAFLLDVSNRSEYEGVAGKVIQDFGAPYILFNNAGIASAGPASTATIDDWQWLVSVNIMGLGYGLSLFVPQMIASNEKGYVVNTGSVTGLMTPPGTSAIYSMTKHAVVAISETLAHELRPHGMHVTVICPGSVATNIVSSDRNKPEGVHSGGFTVSDPLEREFTQKFVSEGLAPSIIASRTFAAMEERRLYMISHPEYKPEIEVRHRQIEEAIQGEPDTDVELIAVAKSLQDLQALT